MTTVLMLIFRLIHTYRCMRMELCRTCDAGKMDFYGPTLILDALLVGLAIGQRIGGA